MRRGTKSRERWLRRKGGAPPCAAGADCSPMFEKQDMGGHPFPRGCPELLTLLRIHMIGTTRRPSQEGIPRLLRQLRTLRAAACGYAGVGPRPLACPGCDGWGRGRERARARLPLLPVTARRAALAAARTAWAVPSGVRSPRKLHVHWGWLGTSRPWTSQPSGLVVSKVSSVLGKLCGAGPLERPESCEGCCCGQGRAAWP